MGELTRSIRCLGIVHRGEAALRCLRTVKALRRLEGEGMRALVLYTAVERDAPFVRLADEAVELPARPGREGEAYLDRERVLAALRAGGADAVWPGWGFLAEDPAFAAAVVAAGLAWLGPPAEVMRRLGDKIAAKELAEAACVPVLPWSGGALADLAAAKAAARRLDYPLLLKAAAGGGGRGIRPVPRERALAEAFRAASEEARTSFGDARVFLEREWRAGRHVEVQIAADGYGTLLALGLRDCSVQRRHQKLVEETPPPGLPAPLARALEEAALRLARRAGYQGLGTVEFLVQGDEFAFLEANPRLQVEHGVTELVTGLDLVELQIRIARGERLEGLAVAPRGAALEVRLCAEDPEAGFAPAPGRVVRFEVALGPDVRIDAGVAKGSRVPASFDSLVAKLLARGETRAEALARLTAALADLELVIEGGATNQGCLLEVLESEAFRAGGVDTGWLERLLAGSAREPRHARAALVAAAILAYQRERRAVRRYFYADPSSIASARVPASAGQLVDLTWRGEDYRLHVFAVGAWRYRVHLDGRVVMPLLREEGGHAAVLELAGERLRVLYDADETGLRVQVQGHAHRFGRHTAGEVRAGSPAVVVAVEVRPGDTVRAGDPLGVLEAMKTEIAFRAPVAGVVREVRVARGQQVRAGDLLLVVEAGGEGSGPRERAARLELPEAPDPLDRLVSAPRRRDGRVKSRLGEADRAGAAERQAALGAAREELRRILLGYDVDEVRAERLLGFLEAPLPAELSESFRFELAAVRREVVAFVDVERLFVRAARASASGPEGPSNYARLRMLVRRLGAGGSGIAEEFLALVRRALAHYGLEQLEPGDALERAVLRLLATRHQPELRRRLGLALVRQLAALARSGVPLADDASLAEALSGLVSLRGLVPDALADAALEARWEIFETPALARAASRASQAIAAWLPIAEAGPAPLPAEVLADLAAAPRAIFDRVGRDVAHPDPRRRAVALAAQLQRLYLPGGSVRRAGGGIGETAVERLELDDGRVVLGAACLRRRLRPGLATLARMVEAEVASSERDAVDQLEVFVAEDDAEGRTRLLDEARSWLQGARGVRRLSLGFVAGAGPDWHGTFEVHDGDVVERKDLFGLHPEVAARVDLGRLSAFALEPLSGGEDLYCFRGRHHAHPEDERLFVLAEVRGSAGNGSGREAARLLPLFEHAFFEATRRLRALLGELDPARRLQWNRLALFVVPPVLLEPGMAADWARRLHPATRHLGLDKVVVRLRLVDPVDPDAAPRPSEIVISDPTGSRLELAWREPRSTPLEAASRVEQRLAESRRRGLLYPYEILRLLTGNAAGHLAVREESALPRRGRFEEWDLDPASPEPRAVCVAGRPLGRNSCSVVFGVLCTPTEKVPEGLTRVVILSDPTFGMGSLGPPECDRIVGAIELAERLAVPVEWIPVSSGARIALDSGTENLDATARVVRRIVTFTEAGGVIHVIVQGVNVGAQSYFDALATMLGHTRGALIMLPAGSMVLTGRAALEASGSVAAEDEVAIGGYEHVMGPNGEAQYFAHDLLDAFRILAEHYRYSYVVPGEAGPRREKTSDPVRRDVTAEPYGEEDGLGFRRIGEIFDDRTNPGRKRPFSMRALLRALLDRDGGWLERWRGWVGAETAIVGDAHLGGHPVCLIGIESRPVPREGYRPPDGPESWSAATLFPQSSKKMARALWAASGNRPVVILANLSGFDGSPESMRKLQLEYGAEIARAVVRFQGPLLFLVVSRYHGGAYVVFSRSLNPELRAAALEGSYASVIGGAPAAQVVFAREVRARAAADERLAARRQRGARVAGEREALERLEREILLEKQDEVAREFDAVHTVERALRVGSLERILPARAMRPYLIGLLEQRQGP